MKATKLALALNALLIGACDLEVTNPNSPGPLGNNPSRSEVAAAATGLLITSRGYFADFVLDVGILGREAYRIDGSDPRFISEFLEANAMDPGSIAFGGDHWFEPARSIRSANNLLRVIGTASALSAAEQEAVRGFSKTMQAIDFLTIVNTHTQGIPVDVDRNLDNPLAPFVTADSARGFIAALLDDAQTDLVAAGSANFPFALSGGFTGFATPQAFIGFNRALKARVEAYRGSWGDAACGAGGLTCYTAALAALAASFVDTLQPLDLGVYHVHGTGPGDLANPLAQDPTASDNVVHPSLRDSVETRPGGGNDTRYGLKVTARGAFKGARGIGSDLSFVRYGSPSAPIPIIRNEELVLLRAEANNALGNIAAAAADIDFIRVKAGGLAPCGAVGAACPNLLTATQAERLGQILKQRHYSLLYEGGHRWIDMRRTGRLNQIPVDLPSHKSPPHDTYPIPSDVCLPRPATGPLACPTTP